MAIRKSQPSIRLMMVGALGTLLLGAPAVSAAEPSTTKIVQAVRYPETNYYSLIAKLSPAHPDAEMKFTLFKKATSTSSWRRVDSATATQWTEDQGASLFRTEDLGVVRGYKCKVVAAFAGDEDHSASRNAVKFSCRNGGGSYGS